MLHRQWINIYRTANESARTPSACECSSGSGIELATALTVSISAQVTEAAGGTGNTPASDCRGGTRTHGRCEVLFSVCSGLTQRLVSWSEMWRFTQQLSSLTVSSGRIKQKFCEASKFPLFWPLSHFSSSHFRLKLICRIKICNPKLHFQIEKLQNVNVKTEPLLLCLSPTGAVSLSQPHSLFWRCWSVFGCRSWFLSLMSLVVFRHLGSNFSELNHQQQTFMISSSSSSVSLKPDRNMTTPLQNSNTNIQTSIIVYSSVSADASKLWCCLFSLSLHHHGSFPHSSELQMKSYCRSSTRLRHFLSLTSVLSVLCPVLPRPPLSLLTSSAEGQSLTLDRVLST